MKKHKDNWVFRSYMARLIRIYLEKKYNRVLVDISLCKDGKYCINIKLIENYSKEDVNRLLNDIRTEFDIKDCHISTCVNWIYGRISHNKLENIRTLLRMKRISDDSTN